MNSPLIPEKPILVSPTLAASIGLEEATLLVLLHDCMVHGDTRFSNGFHWVKVDEPQLSRLAPFWNQLDIQRLSHSLRDKGMIHLGSSPYAQSLNLIYAFNDQPPQTAQTTQGIPIVDTPPSHLSVANQPRPQTPQRQHITPGATLISPNWQPNGETIAHIAQHNIPEHFVREQVPEFVAYWRESGETQRSWGSKFLQQVVRKWREHQTLMGKRSQDSPMQPGWRPSADAIDVLTQHANINASFVEDAIPEFILFWQEKGDVCSTWNTKFIQHVKRQWLRYHSALEHDTMPRRIADDWQPSNDVLDVLRLANIDIDFAQQLIPEFVLYWRESNQLQTSWNTKFLQHVKYHWAKRHALAQRPAANGQGTSHAQQQRSAHSGRTKDHSLVEHLTDRSWVG